MQTNEDIASSPVPPTEEDKIEDEMREVARRLHFKPRWTFVIVMAILAVLLSLVSEQLTVGPRWLVPVGTAVLITLLFLTTLSENYPMTRPLAVILIALINLVIIAGVLLLVKSLFQHAESGFSLFQDAVLLWTANVIISAMWYWEIDQGGPIARHMRQPAPPDFVFPQMAVDISAWRGWKPRFPDYLFLAFNTSTAFSPTDTTVMSWQAKILMMLQSSVSLLTVVVLAARAVNIA